jgi:hypothetical protein
MKDGDSLDHAASWPGCFWPYGIDTRLAKNLELLTRSATLPDGVEFSIRKAK